MNAQNKSTCTRCSRMKRTTTTTATAAFIMIMMCLTIGTSSKSLRSRSEGGLGTNICRVSIFDIDAQGFDDEILLCEILTRNNNDDSSGSLSVSSSSDAFLYASIPSHYIESNKYALMNKTWYIKYPNDWVIQGNLVDDGMIDYLAIPDENYDTQQQLDITVPQNIVQQLLSSESTTATEVTMPSSLSTTTTTEDDLLQGSLGSTQFDRYYSPEEEEKNHNQRRQQQQQPERPLYIGQRTVVVVIVDTIMDPETIYNYIFSNEEISDSLESQIASCSSNQLQIVPHPGIPLLELSVPTTAEKPDASSYTFVELFVELAKQIRFIFQLPDNVSIERAADHFIFIVPDDINRGLSETGWAANGGSWVGVPESWAMSIQNLMHEIGHNFGNAHSYENGAEYADNTNVMGGSGSGTNMCYNGFHMWQMGWFQDRRQEIDMSKLLENRNGMNSSGKKQLPELIELAFFGEYGMLSDPNHVVLAKIGEDIFLLFNRRTGVNADTREYPDTLLIYKQFMGRFHLQSNLVAAIPMTGGSYVIHNFAQQEDEENSDSDLIIEVCGNNLGDGIIETPEMLFVAVMVGSASTIQANGGLCHPDTTTSATTMVAVQNRMAAEKHHIRVTVTYDNKPEETSWVLMNSDTDEIIYNTSHNGAVNLPGIVTTTSFVLNSGRYKVVLNDTGNDGSCCDNGLGKVEIDKMLEGGATELVGWFQSTSGREEFDFSLPLV